MRKLKKKFGIEKILNSPNLATDLSEEDLGTVAQDVISSTESDRQSRADWERLTKKAMKLVELEHESKHTPIPNASNVKYPLITTAVTQFAARTLPMIIRGDKVAEVQVIGKDPDGEKAARATRVAKHLSYQLLCEMEEWEDELDTMLSMLATVGTVFKKTYFDPVKERNASRLCAYDEIIIHNEVKQLSEARRVTHVIYMHKNDLIERMRLGLYSKLTPEELDRDHFTSTQNSSIHEIYEQHCYIDLDGDGYEEPYIVLVDKDLAKVLRIVARFNEEDIRYSDEGEVIRIKPIEHFTDFHFIKSPKGSFYSTGFGQLLYSLNSTVNTVLNQLIDAGRLANTQSGFIDKKLRLPGGDFQLIPGQLQKANLASVEDLRKHIFMLEFKEPSSVLFQLLGTLVEAAKEVASVSDALTGQEKAQNVAATTMLALIEQGTKVFSAIQKRIYSGLRKEFIKLFRLNSIFLDRQQYYKILDDEAVIYRDDYIEADYDIKPVADPSASSDAHRIARTQAQLALIGQPGVNAQAIIKQYLEDLNTPAAMIKQILPPPDPNAPPPPEILDLQSQIQERGQKIELEKQGLQLENMRSQADLLLKQAEAKLKEAQAVKALAEAEAAELGPQLEQYKHQLDAMSADRDRILDALREAKDPETNFRESDIQKINGGIDGQGQDTSPELPGGSAPMETPPGNGTPE